MISGIIDASALVALINRKDRGHGWATEQMSLFQPPLLTCESVLTEASFVLGDTPSAQEALRGLIESQTIEVRFLLSEHLEQVFGTIRRYRDLPSSLADACLVRMSELFPEHFVFTLDNDFRTYRRFGRRVIPLIIP